MNSTSDHQDSWQRVPDPGDAMFPLRRVAARGRGSQGNPDNRYSPCTREAADDGWDRDEDELPSLATTLMEDRAKTVIARNDSPDVPFSQSINPYRGCEHGCAYCFARPTHAYLGLSPGLDFETRLAGSRDAQSACRGTGAAGYRTRHRPGHHHRRLPAVELRLALTPG